MLGYSQPNTTLANGWLAGVTTPSSCSSGNSPTYYNYRTFQVFDCVNNIYVLRDGQGSGGYVPYVGAVSDVNLGSHSLTTTGILQGNIYDIGGAMYNVKAFGAKGDGMTDDTVAFASTVTVACLAHGEVVVPGGNYLATVTIPCSNLKFTGFGRPVVSSFNTTTLTITGGTSAISSVTVSDIVFTAQGGSASGDGILITRPSDGTSNNSHINFYRVTAFGMPGTNFHVQNLIDGSVVACVFNTGLNGIWLDGSSSQPVNLVVFNNPVTTGNTNRGILLGNAQFNTFYDLDVEQNTGTSVIEIGTGSPRNRFFGGDTEGNTPTSGVFNVSCASSCPDNQIIGVNFGELLSPTSNPIVNIGASGDYTLVSNNDFRGGAAQLNINIASGPTQVRLMGNHSLSTTFAAYVTDAGTNTQYLNEPTNLAAIAQTKIRGITVNSASNKDLVLQDGNGNGAFRSISTTGWADGVTSQFTQIGTSAGNIPITGLNGSVMNRLAFSAVNTQISGASSASTPAPTDQYEIVNASGVKTVGITSVGAFKQTGVVFGSLPTPVNGMTIYCSDCTITATCAGSGTGAIAKRLNSVWVCN